MTLRSLSSDGARTRAISLAVAVGLLIAWGLWFVLGRVPIFEVSASARVEVVSAVHPIAAETEGRLQRSVLVIGRRVQAGDLVAELDATQDQLALREGQTRLNDSRARLAALGPEIDLHERALRQLREARTVGIAEARARAAEAEARMKAAVEEAQRIESLRASGIVSGQDLTRARAEADASRAQAQAQSLAAARVEQQPTPQETDLQSTIISARRLELELGGSVKILHATVDQLTHSIELHGIRAPVSGFVGEAESLQPGSMIAKGQRLGSIVPEGALHAVSYFTAASTGRIQPGQPARLQLQGYPWTRFGWLEGRVTHVASEPAEGMIRVEVALQHQAGSTIPVVHGLPGSVEVEVESLSPVALVLRAAGAASYPAR